MVSYKVCGTSNLLEGNKCWEVLEKNCQLHFEGYGDITSALLSDDDCGLITVLFLEDLLQNSNGDYVTIKQSLSSYLNLIEEKAIKSTRPLIICLGSQLHQNIITEVKVNTERKDLNDWLTDKIAGLRDRFESVFFMNLNNIFYQHGAQKMFSTRNWYFGRCRLSLDGLNVLAEAVSAVIERISNPPKKVLVLDCDNTIWGGVIGEDGLQGLVLGQDGLGQAFVDFQKEAVAHSDNGVIIVLASKNNEEEVWNVFDNHDSMVLKRDNIVTAQINWNEKADNLAQIADDLDLNADSFVFWDDNPIERDKMKMLMPQVYTVDVPQNIIEWPGLLRSLDCFAKFKVTTDDKKKADQYRSRAAFTNNARNANDLNSYLSTLNLSPVMLPLSDAHVARAEQMCLKTNQFNLRTKRYSATELIAQNKEANNHMFLVKFSDTYGDHGIVALVSLNLVSEGLAFLDTFLMSCRVLGRHLEAWVLDQIIKIAADNGMQYLVAEFIDTGRNRIAKDFLTTYCFEEIGDTANAVSSLKRFNNNLDGHGYFLRVEDALIPNIEIYRGNN